MKACVLPHAHLSVPPLALMFRDLDLVG